MSKTKITRTKYVQEDKNNVKVLEKWCDRINKTKKRFIYPNKVHAFLMHAIIYCESFESD